jgi:hypothetical protein
VSSLGHLMQDLADAMEVPFQVDRGVYSLEMPTANGRSQLVQVTLQDSGLEDQMILFYTPVGPVSDGIDWRSLLELNVGTVYARTGIIADYIVVVAGQMLSTAELTEVIAMLTEVGTLGDKLEEMFYGAQDRF